MNVAKYQTLVFDCDGVVLNSNKVKTDAFFKAALPYGEVAAQKLVDYHVSRGGISRYRKFDWFIKNVVVGQAGPTLEQLLKAYASEVLDGLLNCEIAENLAELRNLTNHANWLIVSGGDQQELQEVFAARDINKYFDGGIFGSPNSKDEILKREINNGNIKSNALFIGDSRFDYEVSAHAGLDFVFLYGWSEVSDWKDWVERVNIQYQRSLSTLMLFP